MLASCHRRTGPPGPAVAGTGWAGLEQPTRDRKRSKTPQTPRLRRAFAGTPEGQATRTTAAQSYRAANETKTLPVKALGQLDLHPRPRAKQLVCARLAHGDLQVPHAPDVHERLVRPPL